MNNHWESIHGWFDYANIYDKALESIKDGDIIVEIGTWMGKSTCYLAQKIKEKGLKVKFYACDLFKCPNSSVINFMGKFPDLTDKTFYAMFLGNLRKQGVEDIVTPIKGDSLDFANQFEDNSISFLFLDDDHQPEHVYQELIVWYPKMKKGGVLAGHDKAPVAPALVAFKEIKKDWDYIIDGSSWVSIIPGGK